MKFLSLSSLDRLTLLWRLSATSAFALLASFVISVPSASAAACTFTATNDTNFNFPQNWDCGHVPGSADDALVTRVVQLTSTVSVGSLTVMDGATLNVNGNILNTGNLTVGTNTGVGAVQASNSALHIGGSLSLLDGSSISGVNMTLAVSGSLACQSGGVVGLSTGSALTVGGLVNIDSGCEVREVAGSTLSVTGSTALGGVLTLGGGSATFVGDVNLTGSVNGAGSGRILLKGDWNNTGTYQPGSTVVTLGGRGQTLNGSTTFYDLSKQTSLADTLLFQSGSTFTVSHALTLQGAQSNLLSLQSTNPGSQWLIDPQGSYAIAFVNVQDSQNNSPHSIILNSQSVDSGNNNGWNIGDGTPPVITLDAPTLVHSPTITDTTIHVTDNQAIQASSVTVNGTASPTDLHCEQTNDSTVDCTVTITTSGSLLVYATDVAGNAATHATQNGYQINHSAPVIFIGAPTLTSASTITDTTIHVTASNGVSPDAIITSGSATSSASCSQTSPTIVDCTVTITTSGSLLVDATDVAGNHAAQASRTGYVIDATVPGPPRASPVAGTYSSDQYVSLSTTSGAASMRYTTDGSSPGCGSGRMYVGLIHLSSSLTLRAIACNSNGDASAVAIFPYTISNGSSVGNANGGITVYSTGVGGTGSSISGSSVSGSSVSGSASEQSGASSAQQSPSTPAVSSSADIKNALAASGIFYPGNLAGLLQGFGVDEDVAGEVLVLDQVHADALKFHLTLDEALSLAIRNFIVYGMSHSTQKLGQGERRAVMADYFETIQRPYIVWSDIERMTNGQIPLTRNVEVERKDAGVALTVFIRLYGHSPNFQTAEENLAWNTLLYRIRFPRDLVKEAAGLRAYRAIYRRDPKTPFEWATVRVLGYVKG